MKQAPMSASARVTYGRPGLLARLLALFTGVRARPGAADDLALQPYRQLARQLLADFPCAEGGRIVFVAAVDGLPTDTLLTIAYFTCEELGSRLLIVDAADRDDAVGARLGLAGMPGLYDLVRDGARRLTELTHPTARAGIAALAAGRRPTDGAATLPSASVQRVFDEARKSYDYTLVQLPSVLDYPAFLRFAGQADTLLLIVNEGQTNFEDLARSRALLDNLGVSNVRVLLCGAR